MGTVFQYTRRPALCVTIGGATMDDVRRARDDAARVADLVEVRLDRTAAPDAAGAVAGCRVPVLVTCRAPWEGGEFRGSEDERHAVLRAAADAGAAFVDVEARDPASPALIREIGGSRVVLSFHDFDGVPADLDHRARAMAAAGAAVVKIAVRAHRLGDALRVFDLSQQLQDHRFVGLAMGTAGLATRVLAARVGSVWTYAGTGWAPGQIPADRLIDEFRFRDIDRDSAVYGVVGKPIGHSLSPAIHNAAFTARGDRAVYLPFEAESADDFLACAERLGIRGASVTAPFKIALSRVARLDETAARVGALNTMRPTAGGWEGTNTDVDGFLSPLRSRMPLRAVRAAVLGTGGAARAVALALSAEGARVTIHGRDRSRAADIAAMVGGTPAPFVPAPGSWDLLVNATPVGTAPNVDASPVPDGPLDGRLVYDLVYNPPDTRLMRDAVRAGCEVLGGLDMLVAQAQAQQAWWTGDAGDAVTMRRAAERRLAAQHSRNDSERTALVEQS